MDGTAQQLARGRVPFRGSDIPRRAVGSVCQAQRLEYILLCQPVDGLAMLAQDRGAFTAMMLRGKDYFEDRRSVTERRA